MKKVKLLSFILVIILGVNIVIPTISLSIDEVKEQTENEEAMLEDTETTEDDENSSQNKLENNESQENQFLKTQLKENENIKNDDVLINKETKIQAISSIGKVNYSSYIEGVGWEEEFSKYDGEVSGTEGKSKRIEAIKINLNESYLQQNASIKYSVHVQDYGWMAWKQNGEVAGTEGENKRIEAIKIQIEGMTGYSVKYRVHVQDIGWTSWVDNGEIAGTMGKCKRIEAIQIEITQQLTIETEYIYNETNNTVTAIMHSNVELAHTKPTWTLSDDKMSYTKVFSENQTYSTGVTDIYGNTTNVIIQITRN